RRRADGRQSVPHAARVTATVARQGHARRDGDTHAPRPPEGWVNKTAPAVYLAGTRGRQRRGPPMLYRTDYSAQLLAGAPEVLQLGPWRLHYQAYACRTSDPRAPVLLLGGAFQSFRSFAAEV